MQNPTPAAEVKAELNEKRHFVLPCFYASLPGLLALLIFNTVLVRTQTEAQLLSLLFPSSSLWLWMGE